MSAQSSDNEKCARLRRSTRCAVLRCAVQRVTDIRADRRETCGLAAMNWRADRRAQSTAGQSANSCGHGNRAAQGVHRYDKQTKVSDPRKATPPIHAFQSVSPLHVVRGLTGRSWSSCAAAQSVCPTPNRCRWTPRQQQQQQQGVRACERKRRRRKKQAQRLHWWMKPQQQMQRLQRHQMKPRQRAQD